MPECRTRYEPPGGRQRGDQILDCVRDDGHTGDHRAWNGVEFSQPDLSTPTPPAGVPDSGDLAAIRARAEAAAAWTVTLWRDAKGRYWERHRKGWYSGWNPTDPSELIDGSGDAILDTVAAIEALRGPLTPLAVDNVEALLADVDRLRAELAKVTAERDEAKAERDHLASGVLRVHKLLKGPLPVGMSPLAAGINFALADQQHPIQYPGPLYDWDKPLITPVADYMRRNGLDWYGQVDIGKEANGA